MKQVTSTWFNNFVLFLGFLAAGKAKAAPGKNVGFLCLGPSQIRKVLYGPLAFIRNPRHSLLFLRVLSNIRTKLPVEI